MMQEKNWNIDDIQALTEQEAAAMAIESTDIKGHNVYFVDFGGHFGYSALVFSEGMHMYHANDYQLHHNHTVYNEDGTTSKKIYTQQELKPIYLDALNRKLFTESEFSEPLGNYFEYKNKLDYLHNLHAQKRDHLSIFGIFITDAEKVEYNRRKKDYPIYDEIAFAYFADREFVDHHRELYKALQSQYENAEKNMDYLKSAIKNEMANHEYAINWQGNWDVLSVFGNIHYNHNDDPEPYFDQLGWNNDKRNAFYQARSEYMKAANF